MFTRHACALCTVTTKHVSDVYTTCMCIVYCYNEACQSCLHDMHVHCVLLQRSMLVMFTRHACTLCTVTTKHVSDVYGTLNMYCILNTIVISYLNMLNQSSIEYKCLAYSVSNHRSTCVGEIKIKVQGSKRKIVSCQTQTQQKADPSVHESETAGNVIVVRI